MKLIYLANIRIPTEKAHGYQIMKMCEGFSNNGIKVELIVPRRINKIKNDSFKYYGVESKFDIIKLPTIDMIFLGRIGFLIQRFSFLFFSRVYLLFKKYDILYTREEFCGIFFSKFILELHSLPSNINEFRKKIIQKTKKIIVLTEFIKTELIELFNIKEETIFVSPDAVDLKIFNLDLSRDDARKILNLPEDKKIIGYTGRFKTMEMDKGISDILKSIKDLENGIIFVAVGGNKEDVEYYHNIAKEYGILDKVKIIGNVELKTLAIYQKAFDILLMPFPDKKHYRYYMSPMKMFEYMASKRPIISSNLPSILPVLNENNSVLISPDSPDQLTRAVNKLLHEEYLGIKISEQAFLDVQKYTWKNRTEQIINFIL